MSGENVFRKHIFFKATTEIIIYFDNLIYNFSSLAGHQTNESGCTLELDIKIGTCAILSKSSHLN